MRRAVRLAQLAQQVGALQNGANSSSLQHFTRQLGGAAGHSSPETPLTKIMPTVVAVPRQVLSTALSLTGKLLVGAATSGTVKGLVAQVANKVVVEEALVSAKDLDVSFWSYWLGTTGYTEQAGFKKLAEAAKPKVASMDSTQVTSLAVGLHKANYYDKELFDAISAHVSANFTKYDTDELLQLTAAFSDFGYFNVTLYDDIADSITYANHYLAPVKADTKAVVKALEAYAKYNHERADLFITLSRGISEVGLGKLDKKERKETVMAALRAFAKFNFWPEQVDALLYYTKSEADAFTADELKEADQYQAGVEKQANGSLEVYQPGHEDAAHWYAHQSHGHGPQHYDLYVFREALVPKAYSPTAFRTK